MTFIVQKNVPIMSIFYLNQIWYYTITTKEKITFSSSRTLLLQQRRSSCSNNRYIKHFHYLTWPAYPQRNCTTTFLQFLNRLHEKLEIPEEDENDMVIFWLRHTMIEMKICYKYNLNFINNQPPLFSFRVLQSFTAMMAGVAQVHF